MDDTEKGLYGKERVIKEIKKELKIYLAILRKKYTLCETENICIDSDEEKI